MTLAENKGQNTMLWKFTVETPHFFNSQDGYIVFAPDAREGLQRLQDMLWPYTKVDWLPWGEGKNSWMSEPSHPGKFQPNLCFIECEPFLVPTEENPVLHVSRCSE